MNTITIFCALLILLSVGILVASNRYFSSTKRSTQLIIVFMLFFALAGFALKSGICLFLSVVCLVKYIRKLNKYRSAMRRHQRFGTPLSELRRP